MWSQRNKNLTIILLVLVVLVVIDPLVTEHNAQADFKDILISTDSSKIGAVTIFQGKYPSEKIILKRQNNKWTVIYGDKTWPADADKIREVLETLTDLRPTQVMGKGEKAWKTYAVTDSSATQIIVYNVKGKKIAHLYLGETESSQTQRNYHAQPEIATYVRLQGDKNVYLIPHVLSVTFVSDPLQYRNNNLTPTAPPKVSRIKINTGGKTFVVQNKNGSWYLDDAKADSLNCERYVRLLAKVESNDYIDGKNIDTSNVVSWLVITYDNNKQITIKGYGDTTVTTIWSSYNPQTLFKAGYLPGRLFKPYKYFAQKAKSNN